MRPSRQSSIAKVVFDDATYFEVTKDRSATKDGINPLMDSLFLLKSSESTLRKNDSANSLQTDKTFTSLESIRYVEGQQASTSFVTTLTQQQQHLPSSPHDPLKTNGGDANLSGGGSGELDSPTAASNLTREVIAARLSKIDERQMDNLGHLKLGSQFKFRIIIVEIAGIESDYSDIFCQFNFMHRNNEAFSTEPINNSGKGPPLGFTHPGRTCA